MFSLYELEICNTSRKIKKTEVKKKSKKNHQLCFIVRKDTSLKFTMLYHCPMLEFLILQIEKYKTNANKASFKYSVLT